MPKTVAKAKPDRANLIAGFDDLPDSALVDVPTGAAVMGKGESTFWKDAKDRPGHPKIIKLSTRCSRIRVGDLRAYLARLGSTAGADSSAQAAA